jgi:predicted GTPase
MKVNNNIFETMEKDIEDAKLDENTKSKLLKNIFKLKNEKVNLMITGATGSGKSSTINAMFNMDIAKVGIGVDPETMSIEKYELDNLILWDSPGLGDGKEKDRQHSKAIIKKLNELNSNKNPLIDLVLVILDGSSRDLGTSYELINQVIIPNLGENAKDRILVAINQADVAMKGRYWDYNNNKPEPKLVDFLEQKVKSVKTRVKEATGVDIEPIYYSAGYKDNDEEQKPYNLSKLLYFIVKNTPTKKRLAFADNTSNNSETWEDDDNLKDYTTETKKSMMETVKEHVAKGSDIGGSIGSIFGSTGESIGRAIGGAIGAVTGFVSSLFNW